MAHHHITYEPEDDVGEAWAWCDPCGEQRRFVHARADLSALEAGSPSPDVRRAIEGEVGWACDVCRHFRRDLVADESYNPEFANVSALRTEDSEQRLHGEGVGEDLRLRMMSEGRAELHEPATEEDDGGGLHEAVQEDTLLQEAAEEDENLEKDILEDVRRAEAGEVELELPHGPRKEMPPPERLPPRDPTDEDENL